MTVSDLAPHWAEYAARYFEPRHRKWTTPGAMAKALDRTTGQSPALDLLDRQLVELTDGDDFDALLMTMPPQEGKSQRVSRRFPEWLLEHDPTTRIAIVSYEQEMALRWGRDIKNDIIQNRCQVADCDEQGCTNLHISIRQDSSAAGRWETPQGGGVYCVGVGGPLTGRPVDVLIIDDPVKDRAAAESVTIRQSTWDWWESVALTRLAPGGKVVMIQTRWHQDDLAGRMMSYPSPLRWRTVTIPAIATEVSDPLGRKIGDELQSVRGRAPGYFANLHANMSHYTFSGIYQQNPTAAEGNMFRRPAFRFWRSLDAWADGRDRISLEGLPVTLADCWMFHTMDFAASTKTSADYTVIATWAVSLSGDLILLGRARGQVAMDDQFTLADELLREWGGVIYAEKSFYSSTFVTDARDAGYPVAELLADKDKVTRAIPAAGRVHAGRVWFPAEAEWLDDWCDELAAFPAGSNDDQVDTLAYAALVLTGEWSPAKGSEQHRPGAHERAVSQAYQAATGKHAGNGSGDLDIMNVPW